MCSCPAAPQNAALYPYTPASRCHVSNASEKTVYHLSFWNAPLPRWRPQVRVSSTAPAGVRRLAADVFCCARAPPRFKTLRFAPILPPAAALFPMPVRKLYTIENLYRRTSRLLHWGRRPAHIPIGQFVAQSLRAHRHWACDGPSAVSHASACQNLFTPWSRLSAPAKPSPLCISNTCNLRLAGILRINRSTPYIPPHLWQRRR